VRLGGGVFIEREGRRSGEFCDSVGEVEVDERRWPARGGGRTRGAH
jgi:hypothetical protein